MPFAQYRPEWSTPQGGSGYTVLNFATPTEGPMQAAAEAVSEFFNSIESNFPLGVTITFPEEATVHANDGTITGFLPITPPTAAAGTFDADYAAPAGAHVQWRTSTVVAGRRLLGRTFLVPLLASAFDNDGTLNPAIVTAISAAANTLLADLTAAGNSLVVWSRTAAAVAPVTSAVVPDQATILRSRRD